MCISTSRHPQTELRTDSKHGPSEWKDPMVYFSKSNRIKYVSDQLLRQVPRNITNGLGGVKSDERS